MVLQHSSVGNPTLALSQTLAMSCQCRDFQQSYVVIPLAIATRNLFHNLLSLRSLLPFKVAPKSFNEALQVLCNLLHS